MKTIITILLFICQVALSQDFGYRSRQMFASDVISGGIVSGIGSMIHKKENQTNSNAFLKGFLKGAIGGSLAFTGKYLTYEIRNKGTWMGWPCKIIHAAGSSMIENGAQGIGLIDNLAIDYGLVRFDFNGNARIRLQPFAAAGIVRHVVEGHQLSVVKTIQLGTPYFIQKSISGISNIEVGATYVNSISVYEDAYTLETTSHEYIHAFQSRAQLSFNYLYMKNKTKLIYFDIPVSEITYQAEKLRTNYSENIYEEQARRLSNRY